MVRWGTVLSVVRHQQRSTRLMGFAAKTQKYTRVFTKCQDNKPIQEFLFFSVDLKIVTLSLTISVKCVVTVDYNLIHKNKTD